MSKQAIAHIETLIAELAGRAQATTCPAERDRLLSAIAYYRARQP